MLLHAKLLNLKRLKTKLQFFSTVTKRHFAQKLFQMNEIKNWEIMLQIFLLTTDNFECLFDQFASVIFNTIDKHATLRNRSRKQRKLVQQPWITKGILIFI